MSLINKMLQDLDARGGAREDGLQQRELKAVPVPERERRPLRLAGAGVAVVVAALAAWYGWQFARRPVPGPVPVMASAPTPAAAAAVPVPVQVPAPVPVPASAGATAAAPAVTPAVPSAGGPGTATGIAASAMAQAPGASATAATPQVQPPAPGNGAAAAPVSANAPASANAAVAANAPASANAAISANARAPAPALATAAPSAAASRRPVAADASTPRPPRQGAVRAEASVTTRPELTPRQLSENTYRRALAALQDGRLSAAMADLDRALELDPRNDAARQTYVALLLENRRTDDAMRQLRLALGIDARQPGLAMVLARLQLERGGPALDTLMTTLPYAAANADYQAFLAGVLQREQRHAEAAQYYQAALKLSPLNGVWWMGLGISLQADQHKAEAREAFTRARTGNGITPELLAFIDRISTNCRVKPAIIGRESRDQVIREFGDILNRALILRLW